MQSTAVSSALHGNKFGVSAPPKHVQSTVKRIGGIVAYTVDLHGLLVPTHVATALQTGAIKNSQQL